MPARLKALELLGYKTFANRTLFEFAEAITAIVGPNGSGKSNIADSLRWVLGEQSYSLLRGKKTEDMIFSGSELRPRSGMAAATITFDNSDGWLPIDFSEVAITRRAYRDGDNEYLINGQRVRLRDISELLAQSGLAERTYTIIGQGLVDAALALKAEDRRKLFEEAAGIGLYRGRREEAIRRLEASQHNLERLEDILTELEPRLRSLERQAKRALEYEQVTSDLRVLLRDWYGYHWHHAQQELMEARETERVQVLVLTRARSEQAALDVQLAELRKQIQSSRERFSEWTRQSADYYAQRETLIRDIAVSDERIRFVQQQSQSIQDEIGRLEDEVNLQSELLKSVEQDAARLEEELQEATSQGEKAREALVARQHEQQLLDNRIQETRQKLSVLSQKQSQAQARILERTAQLERDRKSFDSTIQAMEKVEKQQKEAEEQYLVVQDNLNEATRTQRQIESALAGQRQRYTEAEAMRRQILDEVSKAEAELERLNARIEILNQAELELSGYTEGTRQLLSAIRQGELKGKPGAVNQFLAVPGELEQAISSAMGEFTDAVLLDSDLEDAFELLDREAARGSLLPLSQLKLIQPLQPVNFGLAEITDPDKGWVGVASDLVQTTADLRQIVDLLFGSVWIVRNRQVARSVLNSATWSDRVGPALARLRIVTLKGEIFYADGRALASGSSDENIHSLLGRQRQLRELEELRSNSVDELESCRKRLAEFETEINALKEELERITEEQRTAHLRQEKVSLAAKQTQLVVEQALHLAHWQLEQKQQLQDQITQSETELDHLQNELAELDAILQQERESLRSQNNYLASIVLDEYQTQAVYWNTRIAVTERALDDERRRIVERQQSIDKTNLQLSNLHIKLEELATDFQANLAEKSDIGTKLAQIGESIANLDKMIGPVEREIGLLEERQARLEQSDTVARQEVSLQDHRQAQTHANLVRRQEALQSLQRRIEEDFGLVAFDYAEQVSGQAPLPFEGMVEQLPRLIQLAPEIEEGIKRLRAQLRRIGPINPEARDEYKSVLERYNFMTEQIADLRQAEVDIREVIQELDELMEREFNKTFESVAVEFKAIFQRLFGGGMARLTLTDPDNLAETGIDIEARLPGRRAQGLSLLSGGERSLTATALVFALLKVSPTPFCVLDEVDAMLDEANVGRFRDLLRELSRKTQFVIVTHNRNTVQAADVIYGVTMGRDSTSQMISLKMDQVAAVFE